MIRKITRSSKETADMSIESLRAKIRANASYLDKEMVEFVIKRLESSSLDPNILKL